MTQHDEKIQEQVGQTREAPRVVELDVRVQLKEQERHMLRAHLIDPRDCRYLNGDEIAEVLCEIL